jgi:hypothetical protein
VAISTDIPIQRSNSILNKSSLNWSFFLFKVKKRNERKWKINIYLHVILLTLIVHLFQNIFITCTCMGISKNNNSI